MTQSLRYTLKWMVAATLLGGVALWSITSHAQDRATQGTKAAGGIAWQESLDAALQASKKDEKPVFVEFEASWCSYCRMFETQTLSQPQVQKALGHFVSLKVDIDKQPKLRTRFGVDPVPTMMVLDSEGQVLARSTGFKPAGAFIEFLAHGLARWDMAKKPEDGEAAWRAVRTVQAAETTPDERIALANTAMRLVGDDDVKRRGLILIVRGRARAEKAAANDHPDFAAARKDFDASRALDPDNRRGLFEQADWVEAMSLAGTDQDKLTAAAKAFLEKHPRAKIKEPMLRFAALKALFDLSVRSGNYDAAVARLEQIKTEHPDLVNAEAVDQQIAQIREAARQASQQGKAPGTTKDQGGDTGDKTSGK